MELYSIRTELTITCVIRRFQWHNKHVDNNNRGSICLDRACAADWWRGSTSWSRSCPTARSRRPSWRAATWTALGSCADATNVSRRCPSCSLRATRCPWRTTRWTLHASRTVSAWWSAAAPTARPSSSGSACPTTATGCGSWMSAASSNELKTSSWWPAPRPEPCTATWCGWSIWSRWRSAGKTSPPRGSWRRACVDYACPKTCARSCAPEDYPSMESLWSLAKTLLAPEYSRQGMKVSVRNIS